MRLACLYGELGGLVAHFSVKKSSSGVGLVCLQRARAFSRSLSGTEWAGER